MIEQNDVEDRESENGGPSHLRDLLGSTAPALIPVPRPAFQAWHRPRKQYVRSDQWLPEMLNLVDTFVVPEDEFRYLSLPGDDFLDIRYIHDNLCLEKEKRIRFLGFNRAVNNNGMHAATINTNLDAIRRLQRVDVRSDVLGQDLRTVGRVNSAPRKVVQRFGSFHAINIDLCDGFAKDGAGNVNPNLFDVLQVLLEAQTRTVNDSLLFITSRIDSNQTSDEIQKIFTDVIQNNIEGCPPFASAIALQWPNLDSVDHFAQLSGEDLFVLGITKYIISQASKFRLDVVLKSVLTYRVQPLAEKDDIVSLAIRLHPNRETGEDPYQLARHAHAVSNVSAECRAEAKIPARVRNQKSIDSKLSEDAALRARCIDETEKLLGATGYDIASYRAWLSQKELTTATNTTSTRCHRVCVEEDK